RDRVGDLGAILDAHRLVVDALGHNLQHLRAPAAGERDAHQPVAHGFQRWRDQPLDAGGVDHWSFPWPRKAKGRAGGPPLGSEMRSSGPHPMGLFGWEYSPNSLACKDEGAISPAAGSRA